MKKMILAISILIGINLYAADKVICEELFKGAISSFYLENSCKYNEYLSSTMRNDFGYKGCKKLFSTEDMKDLNNEILGDSYQKMKKVGKNNFCKSNKAKYYELVENYTTN